MRRHISTHLLLALILVNCLMPQGSPTFAQKNVEDSVKEEARRATQLVARSNYGFVKTKLKGKRYAEALWSAGYYSKTNRVYLSVFIFDSKKQADKYGVEFYRSTRQEEQQNRARGGEFIRYGYVYNEGILFLISGYDDDKVSNLLPLLARKLSVR